MIRSTDNRRAEPNAIRRLRRARDLTMEQLADAVGTDASTINKLEKGKMRLNDRWLPALAKALGATIDEILESPGDTTVMAGMATRLETPPTWDVRPAPVEVPRPAKMPNDVPVKGTAAGSHLRGAFQLEVDTIVDWVRRPPALMNATHAYALFVEGSSMEPRYQPGDLIFVHPDRPPRPGDTVVVQAQNSQHDPIEATIGTLRRRTEKAVVIAKLNPSADVEIRADTVKAIHKVLTTNDLFGV
jgi:phage repressor protein C with HTH and peptisase S24 domain